MSFSQTCAALILIIAGIYAMTWASGLTPIQAVDECPPYDQCTPTYHNPKCKCWDSK